MTWFLLNLMGWHDLCLSWKFIQSSPQDTEVDVDFFVIYSVSVTGLFRLKHDYWIRGHHHHIHRQSFYKLINFSLSSNWKFCSLAYQGSIRDLLGAFMNIRVIFNIDIDHPRSFKTSGRSSFHFFPFWGPFADSGAQKWGGGWNGVLYPLTLYMVMW
jgi:hypothetical protein